VGASLVGAGVLIVVCASTAGCSHATGPPPPPTQQANLIVRTVGTSGWVRAIIGPGSIPGEIKGAATARLPGARVIAQGSRQEITATADRTGVARFRVPPGRYQVRLADSHPCGALAASARVTVSSSHVVYAQVTCEQP
jgi:hypothetical protein